MMRNRYFLVLSLTLILILLAASCNLFISLFSNSDELIIQPQDTVIDMNTGGIQYSAIKKNANDGSYENVTENAAWSSSNRAIAMVSTYGYVTPVSPGIVTISAEYRDMTGTAKLTIINNGTPGPEVPSVEPTPEPTQTPEGTPEPTPTMESLLPEWARSSIVASNRNKYNSVRTDESGDIYACGYIFGTTTYNFGNGEIIGTNGSENCLLVKYAPDGSVIWSKTIVSGSTSSVFNSLVIDLYGNVNVVGTIYGTGTYNFGDGVTAMGKCTSGTNLLIVQYGSDGVAKWAQTVSTGTEISGFLGVDADYSGNIYAAGYIRGTSSYMIGSIPVSGACVSDNALVVKFASDGTALWAKSVTSASSMSKFSKIHYNSGFIYAAGYMYGTTMYNFGCGGISGQGANANPVLVKYAPDGTVSWSKTTIACAIDSAFQAVTGDSTGTIYVGGYIKTQGIYNFGCGDVQGPSTGNNAVVVQYDSSGTALWARTVTEGSNYSEFTGMTYYGDCIYAAGYILTSSIYNFGCGQISGLSSGNNAVIVKYDTAGNALTAKTVLSAIDQSNFTGVSSDPCGQVYAAGTITGSSLFDFGGSAQVNGASSTTENVVIVKYRP